MEVAIYSKVSRLSNNTIWAKSGFAKLDCLWSKQALQIRECLASLLRTTNGIDQSSSGTPKPQDSEDLVMCGLFAGFQLCYALQSSVQSAGAMAIETTLCQFLRLAGMLDVATTCLMNTRKEHLFDRLTREMMFKLQHIHISPHLPQSVLLALLWTCYIGAYAASASSKQMYFLHSIARPAQSVRLETWINVLAHLLQFPCLERSN